MITQKVPQGFREAVDTVEKQLHAGGDATTSDLVILSFLFTIDMEFGPETM